MGSAGAIPRDDRAWPRNSFVVSLIFLLVCLGTGIGTALAAADREPLAFGLIVAGFVLSAVGTAVVYAVGMRAWLRGESYPGRMQILMLLIGAIGIVLWPFDTHAGVAVVAGLMGGMFAANAWAIRAARSNRESVDRAEAAIGRERESQSDEEAPPGPVDRKEHAPVGRVLRERVALERRYALAWLVAGAIATGASLALDLDEVVTFVVVVSSGVASVWVLRRLWGAWLARRDFTRATHPPRRAFVVLLNDPAPKMIRPLLAVWSEAPEATGGRMPRPEAVYRSDDELLDLQCLQGDVVVHEAWVDAGPRRTSKPRWVAADDGIALPHRRALFGRWYVGSLIGGERPGRPQALTMPSPRPDDDVTVELGQAPGRFVVSLAWRLLWLAAVGLLMVLLV